MKLALLLLTLAGGVDGRALRQDGAADCLFECQAHASAAKDDFCASFRNQIPRPTLFTRCGEAYTHAIGVGCDLCYDPSKYSALRTNIFNFCDKWGRGHPHSYAAACQKSYAFAINRIEDFLLSNGYITKGDVVPAPAAPAHVYESDVESAESIVERHLREARAEARQEAMQDRFDRHL
ncbi:hypothetical protein ACHHYP_13732 [Achlya hypogyna]|uniref:Secreted protein n=1 Tax=Achlya hypogyna TaxID=1202772 RepID=A0A0A7CPJ3_ACHHY|nr:secreted protein [Achlya hypogyna]OQR84203.1 hypothetical protein ACHHYP_13732 [Achlya hypogyna]